MMVAALPDNCARTVEMKLVLELLCSGAVAFMLWFLAGILKEGRSCRRN